ncbi:hypothetical protein Q4485_14965 [Granulosicoccaceae sp. 1_MG-2023]|nr:hypothetical protein [Granulosicoccaceae sp. 1_MG-2023]
MLTIKVGVFGLPLVYFGWAYLFWSPIFGSGESVWSFPKIILFLEGGASPQIAGLLVVPAGCLDTDVSIRSTAHIFISCKAGWDDAPADVPKFEGLPD